MHDTTYISIFRRGPFYIVVRFVDVRRIDAAERNIVDRKCYKFVFFLIYKKLIDTVVAIAIGSTYIIIQEFENGHQNFGKFSFFNILVTN